MNVEVDKGFATSNRGRGLIRSDSKVDWGVGGDNEINLRRKVVYDGCARSARDL